MPRWSLRTKILVLALLPLLASLALLALVLRHQQGDLARREHALVERSYMQARRSELANYVALASSTVAPLYARGDTPELRAQALQALQALDYGRDGYFFVYDLHGRVLMHSRQPELVGQELWTLRDPQGRPTIQQLIERARAGGGYVEYLWRKPSSGQTVPKLGFVTAYPRWNWMLGTGLYLDDIDNTLRALEAEAGLQIDTTMLWIGGIAFLGLLLTAASGLALNLREHRVAENQLRLLARQVQQSQEDERAHLARELHDGIGQALVSTKLTVEAAAETASPALLAQALERLNSSLAETRRISHRLRPALLDTLGLPAALQHLAREFEDAGGLQVTLRTEGSERELRADVKTALFRIAQEGLTNVVKHARAQHAELVLAWGADGSLRLMLTDDGCGFDAQALREQPDQGIGLRNMRERLAAIGARLVISAAPGHGTQIEARLPRE